jgi:predicted GNAT family acetyltransferase
MLDNPIWHALTTEQAYLAEVTGGAARFRPDFTALAGVHSPEALPDLARLLGPNEVVGLLVDVQLELPSTLRAIEADTLVQMVHEGIAPPADSEVDVLGPADVPAMRSLAALTRPGPFVERTAELGTFVGIRIDGKLVTMAGQRMRLPGLVEVSAICTHPDHLGRGHAARVIAAQLARIRGSGASAFLHVREQNARAVRLYERLGFRMNRRFGYLVVTPTPAGPAPEVRFTRRA